MAKKTKAVLPSINPGTQDSSVNINDKHQLSNLLIKGADAEIAKEYSDYQLDKANEKFLLLSGVETSWRELREAHAKYHKFINAKIKDWSFTFPEELYRQWRRLKGWDINSKSRPMIFAAYTVRDIYGSLPREIYPTLDVLNEFSVSGMRKYRHFQLLTDSCHNDVREVIKTAVRLATSSRDLYEYRVKLAGVYGKPFSKSVYQLDMFRDNDDIMGSI